jgi:predicted metal-dependent HD superfamily phosphohydrolase
MTLPEAWEALFPGQPKAGADLIERWSEPHRRYHTVDHLESMLSIVDAYADAADDVRAVRLACGFHDCVYDPQRTDNEIRSAEVAAKTLGGLGVKPDEIAEVVRLVWLTTGHNAEADDRNGALLCDADLAILATAPEQYARYAAEVRDEYRHVPDDLFRAGRIAVLQGILALPQLYRLAPLREEWEARARANIADEISALHVLGGEDPNV